mgnify:CR=1 FL=1
MATKRMLIDAAHPEETRVAVLDGNQLEELDVESAARRQLKGNIYLAKVTRVEPSLQAAFVDYGGNRHGFLAFSEIHPDYYQIPVADREKLLAENAEASAAESDDSDDETETENGDSEAKGKDKIVETVGGDDIDEVEAPRRSFWPAKRYKIQEVIKRRQILLIQVVKEERGNKGAALTTYLSLAGRYCVLMPNTGKGGGISRKIGNGGDRKRLKTIISGFDIPDGMAVIVRTAGADRSKAEIKRDYEYLIKLWTGIRNLTLESSAPALIHEEANIIKRAIRDHYSRDFVEVLVEGDGGYRMAKDLMKLLIPSHAKKVQPYKDPVVPLFNRYHIESQLETMNSTNVQLKSGGYIVINITEALVAVDVNSGRATRGRNIEETALKTNLEAATEVARQLRLRDLAGLIVIDFIDMDVHRNQTVVERRLKEAMRKDRARIQIGQISPFGLLELSRQRLRPSITETISEVCPHCDGSGIRRSTESTALHVLRGVEEEGARNRSSEIEVQVHSQVALYILNHKREALADIESKFGIRVVVGQDDGLIPPEYEINRSDGGKLDVPEKSAGARSGRSDSAGDSSDDPQKKKRRRRSRRKRPDDAVTDNTTENEDNTEVAEADSADTKSDGGENQDAKSQRRRRGRRGGRRRTRKRNVETETAADSPSQQSDDDQVPAPETESAEKPVEKTDPEIYAADSDAVSLDIAASEAEKDEKPKKRRRVRRKNPAALKATDSAKKEDQPEAQEADTKEASEPVSVAEEIDSSQEPSVPAEKPPVLEAPTAEVLQPAETAVAMDENDDSNVTIVGNNAKNDDKSSRSGWWQRLVE